MKTDRKVIIAVIVALICAGAVFKVCGHMNFSSPSSKETDGASDMLAPVRLDGTVMSLTEFQTWLAKRGYYKGKIDGKVSPDWRNSETQKAWDAMFNDQCGAEDVKAALGDYIWSAVRTGGE